MPTSHYKQIPTIIETAVRLAPSSVLEVGIGCGKWGVLLREYLTVWDHYFEPWGSVPLAIDGIEVHGLYASSPGWSAYDAVLVGDARDLVPHLVTRYDLGLMVDVLEHFDHEDGLALIDALLSKCSALLIAVPGCFAETVEVWDNPHEVHRADWTVCTLRNAGYAVELVRNDDSRVMVVTR